MTDNEAQLVFGLRGGSLVGIDDVPRGLACDCVCPCCGHPLVARKGPIKTYHFAHHAGDDCGGALESTLHLLAKEVLQQSKRIALPGVTVTPIRGQAPVALWGSRMAYLEEVILEQRTGALVPDVVCTTDGEELFVEIYVFHRVDAKKLRAIRKLGVSTIEIDISHLYQSADMSVIASEVVDGIASKKWLFHQPTDHQRRMVVDCSRRVPLNELKRRIDFDDRDGMSVPFVVNGHVFVDDVIHAYQNDPLGAFEKWPELETEDVSACLAYAQLLLRSKMARWDRLW